MRHTTPFNEPLLFPLSRWVPEAGTGLGFFGANPNEEFVTLDFHRPEAKQAMLELAAKSDVMVQNFRPGTFDRWGIGYQHFKQGQPAHRLPVARRIRRMGPRPRPGLVRHSRPGHGRRLRDHG